METCKYESTLLPEEWVLGKLDPEAAADFEEHLMGCAACQEAVFAARGLRQGLALVAAQQAARPLAPISSRRRYLAWAAVLPLAFALLFWWRGEQRDKAAAELEMARLETSLEQARGEGSRQEAVRRAAEARSRELEQRLEASRAAAASSQAEPLVDLPTFLLALVRDRPAGADLELRRSRLGKAYNLAIDLPDPAFDRFRIVLAAPGGRVLLTRDRLEAGALEALLLTLPADFLPDGESRLQLFGRGPGRPEQELASFRIVVSP